MKLALVDAARRARDVVQRGESVAIVVVLSPHELAGRRRLVLSDGTAQGDLGSSELDAIALDLAQRALAGAAPAAHTVRLADGDHLLYVEAHHAKERLVVVGAGHIAVPLARHGVALGYDVIVLDDREAFATAERFAPGVDVRRADFGADPFAGVRIDGRTSIALVTRGHRWDFDCLRRLLDGGVEPRYIGMIGSRRRVRAALGALLRAGYPRGALARIAAPIGLDVGAETPEEIAVAIAAELVLVRRGGSGEPNAARQRVLDRLLREPVDTEETDGGS